MPINPKTINSQPTENKTGQETDLASLLAKNIELSEEILKSVKYIKKYIFWQKIFGFIKILLIVIPLVLGYIMITPYLNQAWQQYKDLLGLKNKATNMAPPVNINLEELNKLNKK